MVLNGSKCEFFTVVAGSFSREIHFLPNLCTYNIVSEHKLLIVHETSVVPFENLLNPWNVSFTAKENKTEWLSFRITVFTVI